MAVENLITEHIDIWTSAIKTKSTSGRGSSKKLELYGVKKLRELILELAVRGKLVPQDANDEPVATLLKQNHIEQSRLTVEENLKTKASQSILDSEEYILVPETWGRIKLGNLAKFIDYRGKTPKKLSAGVRLITAKNVKFGYLSLQPEEFISEAEYKTWMTRGFPRIGDILFTPEAPLGNVAQVDLEEKFALAQRAICLQFHLSDISNYLRLFLMSPSFQNLLSEKATGTTAKGIKASVLKELVVYIPPIEEQHRIVAKVDELMALCDQLEQQTEASIEAHQVLVTTLLDTLTNSADADELMQNWARISEHFDTLFTTEESIDQLKQTILQLAVMGKLVHFGADPMEAYVKDVISFGPRNGLSPKEVQVDTGIKVLKLGATSYGSLNLDESKSVDVDIEKTSHLWLKKGDILIQRGNSANYVGCNCLVKEDVCDVIYPDLMMKIRPSKTVSSEFLSTWLSSPMAREFMWTRMTGTSGTMPKISKKVVEAIPIIVPSRKIQDIIVSKVEELFSICELLKQLISETQQTQSQLTDTIVEQAV
ncbi:restriction endonuclease subunit S [Vibrio metschnikovii]|uniref:restriction endonuclease subunit S n=1 Tax=Vibrio metschnikovii TaxID=28172 RepID=UPI0029FBA042|nr:restriction endonuclease subunit S [Vibrio metschnikovii]EKO3890212.1 restriction endonuclease subunit S [Vibrio metschnikovii]